MHIKNSIIWMVDHSHFESCYYFFLVFLLFLFFFKGIRNVKNPNPSPNPNPRTKKGRKGWMPPPPNGTNDSVGANGLTFEITKRRNIEFQMYKYTLSSLPDLKLSPSLVCEHNISANDYNF